MTTLTVHEEVGWKVLSFVQEILDIKREVIDAIEWDKTIQDQVELDSLRAFDMIVYIHESMGVELPENIGVDLELSVDGIASYIITKYDHETVHQLLSKSDSDIKEMMSDDEDFDDF